MQLPFMQVQQPTEESLTWAQDAYCEASADDLKSSALEAQGTGQDMHDTVEAQSSNNLQQVMPSREGQDTGATLIRTGCNQDHHSSNPCEEQEEA